MSGRPTLSDHLTNICTGCQHMYGMLVPVSELMKRCVRSQAATILGRPSMVGSTSWRNWLGIPPPGPFHSAISLTTRPASSSQAARKVDSAAAGTGIAETRSRARSATNLIGRQRPCAIARRAAERNSFETCFTSRASSKGKNSMQRARTSRGKTRSAGLLVCERRRGIEISFFHAGVESQCVGIFCA